MQFNKPLLQKRILLIISILTPVILIMLFLPPIGEAAVTLIYFKAIPDNGKVFFEWKTANEMGNAGFIINKWDPEENDYIQIPKDAPLFFYTEGDGYTYEGYYDVYTDTLNSVRFFDDDVQNGNTYIYKLESIPDDSSLPSSFSPTQVVMPWDPSQPTWTATVPGQTGVATSTPSPTPTQTQPGQGAPTNTPTRTATKSSSSGNKKTATPVFTATNRPTMITSGSTSTSQPTSNNQPSGNQSTNEAALTGGGSPEVTVVEVQPTATLVPLPSMTIVFPTAIGKVIEKEEAAKAGGNSPKANSASWLTPQRMVVVAVIASIWIMLGGWFYLSFKRLEK